jgi:hypothetical protein
VKPAAAARVGRGTVTSRYKGYTLKRQVEGGWVVPQLDSGSVFEDKHEAKRFVDSQIYGVKMKLNGRGRSPRRNAVTRKRRTTNWGFGGGKVKLSKAQKRRIESEEYARVGQVPAWRKKEIEKEERAKLKAGNPRGTLVPAKLKRMPNGTIKVYVSPGAVARLKGTAVNPKPKRRRRR